VAAKKKSAAKKPVSLEAVVRLVDTDLASARVKSPQPVLDLFVPTKPLPAGSFFRVVGEDAGDSVYLRLAAIRVPKARINDAIKMLRRLHEL
jgi:uncharacterized membrane protein